MTNILTFISPTLIASGASALLTFAPNPLISQIGFAGSMALGGYAMADRKERTGKTDKAISGDRRVRDLHHELADVKHRLRLTSTDLKKRIEAHQETERARQGLIGKVKALETAIGPNKAASPLIDTCAYTRRLEALQSQLEATQERLADAEVALDNERASYESRVAKARQDALMTPSKRLELEEALGQAIADKTALTAAYHELQSALEQAGLIYDAELDQLATVKESLDGEALATIQHWKGQAMTLAARVQELEAEAKKPARFGGTGSADVTGNKVIDFFESKGIQFAAHETDPDLDKGLEVSLRPVTPCDLETIRRYMGELQVATNTHSVPKVTYSQRCYRFRLAVNEPFRTAAMPKLTSNLKRLEKAIDLANHLRIVGSSGSGKSTFLDNAIWAGRLAWPDAVFELADPKFPFTPWSSLEPKYCGAEATVDAVIAISELMEKRMDKATEAKKSGLDIPDFPRYILAVDEATVALSAAKRLDVLERKGDKVAVNFGLSLSSLLRLGRALGFKGYFLSQSLLVSKVGLNEGDFENATSIYLNAMIDKALSTELKELFTPDKLTAISREYDRRKEAGQAYIGLVADTNRDELFLFECPTPGYYYDLYTQKNGTPVSGYIGVIPTVPQASPKAGEPLEDNDGSHSHTEAASSPVEASPTTDNGTIPHLTARCPECLERSDKLKQKTPLKSGKYRFKCVNKDCKTTSFSALSE
jgi:hypothetical protein